MYSLFNALHEGRLIELPDNQKDHALQLLAHLIEAIPDLPAGTDVAGGVLVRERGGNTGLGKGWACPHARIPGEGEMMCAIGWSPNGIDYGAPDGLPVRLRLLDLVGATLEAAGPDARARMIRIEAPKAVAGLPPGQIASGLAGAT